MPYIQFVAIAGFSLTWICQMVSGGEKVLFMRGKDYTEFYVDFVASPMIMKDFSSSVRAFFVQAFEYLLHDFEDFLENQEIIEG